MTKTFDPVRGALNAIENASRVPVTREDVRALPASGQGESSHLRALFGDVDLRTLLRSATLFEIDNPTLARAYDRARKSAAANAGLDEYVALQGF